MSPTKYNIWVIRDFIIMTDVLYNSDLMAFRESLFLDVILTSFPFPFHGHPWAVTSQTNVELFQGMLYSGVLSILLQSQSSLY